MRQIYHEYFEDEFGEADAFYEIVDGKLKLITCWSLNDAHYRDEYMSSLFKYLGVDIVDLPKKHRKKAEEMLRKAWGV